MSCIADEWRKGQIAYNVLAAANLEWAEEIRATDLDPFYRDERLDDFWRWLNERNTA